MQPQPQQLSDSRDPDALPPSRIAAIIDDLDIEGLPTAGELEALAASPRPQMPLPLPQPTPAPPMPRSRKHARSPSAEMAKPFGRTKRALKAEVHELQGIVDRMQAQVDDAAAEIHELTQLVGQLVHQRTMETPPVTAQIPANENQPPVVLIERVQIKPEDFGVHEVDGSGEGLALCAVEGAGGRI